MSTPNIENAEILNGSDSYEAVFESGFEHLASFHESNSIEDLSRAIAAFKRANDITSNDRALVNLANTLFRRFELTDDASDLDAAITAQQAGIALQIESSAVSLNNLGNMLRIRFERISHSASDLENVFQAFRDAMRTTAKPNVLLESARSYAELSLAHNGPSSALGAYKFAMDLIPRISTAGTSLIRRYSWIPNIRECVNGAVATAIEVGNLELALEWFERGRCVVWGQILQRRTPLDKLRQANSGLADTVEDIFHQISKAEFEIETFRGQSSETPGRDEALRRGRDLAHRLDELVRDVRCLDGFQDFMQPMSTYELQAATAHSPIVLLNTSPTRCDALVLLSESNSIIHIPLPQLSSSKAAEMQHSFQQLLEGSGVRMRAIRLSKPVLQSGMDLILSELWLDIVEPILKNIGHLEPMESVMQQQRRITWCPSGPLCFLPLHAAGIYTSTQHANLAGCPKVFDFVISSYTPSISVLLDAVRRQVKTTHAQLKILAVSQPATPKLNPIPCTVDEIAAVQQVVGTERLTWLNHAEAKTSSVLALIDKYPCVHFACHGIQDSQAPMQSAFKFYDGGVDLRMIMELNFSQKELAILSACQTAMGDDVFPDEVIALSTGMLMAGYRSVVGTMWSIGDKDAPIVMGKLYSCLFEGHEDSSGTAYALHQAVRYLRERVGEENFLQWVPFIHIGV
ncbi:hypothetical protein GYMLUDRAFT_49355 [Collybiopsis luxurians FD-317 M1]|uniref:CHAT domain-containing protein n=1 Tax=Collybiopsis luxurians FD-317 M1 TaxID=944289 RepID=A0A0D0CED6_9AGAR|nr:hypothetical protein GYMLUDRAFT_49355 [Collybiopsis luxurians FD-317 M1]